MHLLDTVGHKFLQFGDDDGRDGLDEFFHFVQTLLLVVHVHFLQLSDQVAQDVVFLVLEAANHSLSIYNISQHFFRLLRRHSLLVLGSFLLIIKEANEVVLLAEIERIDSLLKVLLNLLIQWLHVIQGALLLELLIRDRKHLSILLGTGAVGQFHAIQNRDLREHTARLRDHIKEQLAFWNG